MKRVISIILIFCMLFSFSVPSLAAGTKVSTSEYSRLDEVLLANGRNRTLVITDEILNTLSSENLNKLKLIQETLEGKHPEYGVLAQMNLFIPYFPDLQKNISLYLVKKDKFSLNYNYSANRYELLWASWDYNFATNAPIADFDNLKTSLGTPIPEMHEIRVNYQYEDGSKAAESNTKLVEVGKTYEIISPTIAGYTATQNDVSGVMGQEDKIVTITYKKNTHKLTINYVFEDGSKAQNSVWKTPGYNDSYSVESPILPNCVADKTVISGKMPDNDLTETVTYRGNVKMHNLTINYVYSDGSKAAESVIMKLGTNVSYLQKSPVISGYNADKATVMGRMPDSDLTVNVTYSKLDSGGSCETDPDNPGSSGSTDPPEKPDIGDGDVDDPFQKPDDNLFSGYDPFKLSDGFKGKPTNGHEAFVYFMEVFK